MSSIRLNCVTITTDASFCVKTKAAGYAFIISYSNSRDKVSGALVKTVPNSAQEAEVMCIANALARFADMKVKTKLLVINIDCKFAIPKMESPTIDLPYAYLLVNALIKRVKAELGCTVEFRHVKAHSGVGDSRSRANEWCDTEAKMWRQSVQEFLKKNKRKF